MNWIQYWWREFWRYMDTSVPDGYKEQKFTDTKYMNIEKCENLLVKYDFLDKTVIEMAALDKFLSRSDEQILFDVRPYMDGAGYEKSKRNG